MKTAILVFAAASCILVSCGTSKKLDTANAQIQRLDSQVTALNSKVADDDKLISQIKDENAQLKSQNAQLASDAEAYRKAQEARSARLEKLNSVLAEQGTSMEEIRRKASQALQEFKDAGIKVTYKNGLVYISMGDKLMFPTGSAKVNEMGRQALSVVADVLIDNPSMKAIIVGNTDSVKYSNASLRDNNWTLSALRAIAIVKVLRDKYGIDPARLTAAGKGKYDPVADNSTEEGRAQNRRTDIILNPDLVRIWNLMEKAQ